MEFQRPLHARCAFARPVLPLVERNTAVSSGDARLPCMEVIFPCPSLMFPASCRRKEGTEAKVSKCLPWVKTIGEPNRVATTSSCPCWVSKSLLKGGGIAGIARDAITLHVHSTRSLGRSKRTTTGRAQCTRPSSRSAVPLSATCCISSAYVILVGSDDRPASLKLIPLLG